VDLQRILCRSDLISAGDVIPGMAGWLFQFYSAHLNFIVSKSTERKARMYLLYIIRDLVTLRVDPTPRHASTGASRVRLRARIAAAASLSMRLARRGSTEVTWTKQGLLLAYSWFQI